MKDRFITLPCLLTYPHIHTNKKVGGHTQAFVHTHSTNTQAQRHTFTRTHHHMVYWRLAAKFIISQLMVVQDKWRRTEECGPSEDPLLLLG